MKVFSGRIRAVFWGFAVVLALAALGLQAAQSNRENLRLGDELRNVDDEIRQLEKENHRLRRDIEALKSDPYRRELELRKGGRLGQKEQFLIEPQ